MASKRKRTAWSKTVEAHGIRVRLFERGGTIYRDVVAGRRASRNGKARTVHDVRSLGHSDRTRAENETKELCAELAKVQLNGTSPDELTLGQLFRLYRTERMPVLSPARRRVAEPRIAMFTEAWTIVDVDQSRIDTYVVRRRSGEIRPPGIARYEREDYRVRDGTIDTDLRWLNSVFNWACGRRVNGKPLLASNPLRNCDWPREKNKRRPVATHTRFLKTLEHVDTVDPDGRLRCVLELCRYTGRRERAVLNLTADTLLLTEERIRQRLATLGRDEGLAEHMPFGAMHWTAESDKEGVSRVTPLSRAARTAIDGYLRRHPVLGAAPLFPAPNRPDTSLPGITAYQWLKKAERLAGLPKLAGGAFHPYRRLFASERAGLPDVAVAEAGGWKSVETMRASYQRASAAAVFDAVNAVSSG